MIHATLSRPLPVVKQSMGGKCGPASIAIALQYFGKIWPWNAADNCELSERIAGLTHAFALPWMDSLALCRFMTNPDTLAATARLFRLHAKSATETLDQISTHVANQEVVLIGWSMGPRPEDSHWSAVQAIDSLCVRLRDPWPTSPSDNFMWTREFLGRSLTPGYFPTVRISDQPLA